MPQTAATLPRYTYEGALAASQKINWTIEDVLGGRRLDFARPFLPEALAPAPAGLSPSDRLALNQVRGHEYLSVFGLVEEFILPFVLDHARSRLSGDDHRVRALLQFASEEAKHIQLFKRFRQEFEAGFGTRCEVIGPPEAVAAAVLAHDPLAVALTVLHVEWMTQAHYVDSVADADLDPLFKSLLRHHWMEEAQHAKLDTLMVHALADSCDAAARARAVDQYLEIGAFLDAGLRQQVDLDLASFQRATGRILSAAERDDLTTSLHRALRWTYLGSGMTHPRFLQCLEYLGPEHRRRVAAVAPTFS